MVQKEGGEDYLTCSAGEARRLDICMLLSILDLMKYFGKEPQFIVFDEIFDKLDATGLDKVITLLYNINYKNVFVISHNDNLKEHFHSLIKITNDDGKSMVWTETEVTT